MPVCETCGATANLTIPTRLPVGKDNGDLWQVCTWCYERNHQHIPDPIETVKLKAQATLEEAKTVDYHYAYAIVEQLAEVVEELLAVVESFQTAEEDR